MTRPKPMVAILALSAVTLVTAILVAPRLLREDVLSGYVEGEPLYLASPISGRMTAVSIQRGDHVTAGQRLFAVDPAQLTAQRDQAAAELAAAQAQALDARKGQRPAELAVFEANIAAAEARARDANADLRRAEPLVRRGIYAPARLDDLRAAAQAANAAVAAAKRQRDAATLGARTDQVRAADSRVAQAQAALSGAGARLAEVSPVAPAGARVEEVFYQPGEWVTANQPIVSLLPDDRMKLRFFVPETAISAYRPGGTVTFSCDGCAAGMTAKIVYISPRPEFTPPVIYSRDARDRLVYLVEARPSARLNPGQPVDVTPLKPEPGP